jgi:folate-binding protein YgfZ
MGNIDYYIHNCSISVAEGKDCIEHINRLITSNIKSISDLQSIDTLICNANGRITDSLQILRIQEQLLILGNSEVAEDTRKLIVSGIHWNEDVRIMNGDEILSKISIIGYEDDLLEIIPKEYNRINNNWLNWKENYFKLSKHNGKIKIDVILKTNEIDSFIMENFGPSCNKLGIEKWVDFRISNGILSFDEYKHNFLPSELGLDKFVDLKKGCYPGQEIHARLESREKRRKKILRFSSDKEIQLGKYLSGNGTKINITTSVGNSGFLIINNLEEEIKINEFILKTDELDTIEIS